MKTYEITLKHDHGEVTISIQSTSIQAAIKAVCEAEGAPTSAVQTWRVVPTKKQVERTKNLLRGI